MKREKSPKEIWADEERLKRKQALIDKAKAEDPNYDGPSTAEEAKAREDWAKMAEIAKIKFPEHLAAKFDINPRYKIAAVASVLGWSWDKIAKAAGVSHAAVGKWFANEKVKEFRDAFEFHIGQKDSKELIARGQYNAIQILTEIMENPDVSAATRAGIAQWIYEQQHGKPKESREITGVNVRQLTEQLAKMKRDAVILDFSEPDGLVPRNNTTQ